MITFRYLVYRIFETKWKRKIWDEATDEMKKIQYSTPTDHTLQEYIDASKHFNKSMELMNLIL